MRRRAFALLGLTSLALAACATSGRPTQGAAGQPYAPSYPPAVATAPAGREVAILLPLSGAMAPVGQAILNAAQLALAGPGGPRLDARDTGGTPEGAARAASEAIASGAGLILGPLTAAETASVAPIAAQAGVAVLAFTNDAAQARPDVWTLGITPAQQVGRMVAVAQSRGKSRFAGMLPDTGFGHAMADALSQAAAGAGAPTPTLAFYAGGMSGITSAARAISDYGGRRGPIDAQARAARASGTAEGRKQAAEIIKRGIPPAPFDALLLADTGEPLDEVVSLLDYYDIGQPGVKYLGPVNWASVTDELARQRGMGGAWYAAPDPAGRSDFVAHYTDKFGSAPPLFADLGFDAARIAATLSAGPGFSPRALTRTEGFAGIDGPLALRADGTVRRGLAVFEIQHDGPVTIEPAAMPGA